MSDITSRAIFLPGGDYAVLALHGLRSTPLELRSFLKKTPFSWIHGGLLSELVVKIILYKSITYVQKVTPTQLWQVASRICRRRHG